MHEVIINLHMHTRYSDGSGAHGDIARAALRCGLDAVIVTDHNVWISGVDRYVHAGKASVLVLCGEEIHDRRRHPQKSHLLVLGAGKEFVQAADDPAELIREARGGGALTFIAHPVDPEAPAFHEPDISWEDWSADGFTGIELWNGFSEFKSQLHSALRGLILAFAPALVAVGPHPRAVQLWDELLTRRPIVAIGGSDAHALQRRAGPIRRTVFQYENHFQAVNTHVLLAEPMGRDPQLAAAAIYEALSTGRCFIAYDLPHSTRGFRFAAHGLEGEVPMGGSIPARGGVTLHARLPDFAEVRLIKDGRPVVLQRRAQALTYRALHAGVYRIEAFRRFYGMRRAWIISNPIYVT